MVPQDIGAALHQNNPCADAPEKLGEFAGDDPSAEDDHAFWHEIEVEDVVARPGGHGRQPLHGWHTDFRAGADEDVIGMQRPPIGEFKPVRIKKARMGPKKFKLPLREGLHAILGELGDEPLFPRVHRLHVGLRQRYFQSEGFSPPGKMEHVRHVEQGLRRHAAAEDAQTTQFAGPIDDRGLESERDGDACRVETGAAAADHQKVVGFHFEERW